MKIVLRSLTTPALGYECVYPDEKFERTLVSCFRYAFGALLFSKNLYLRDLYDKDTEELPYTSVYRHLSNSVSAHTVMDVKVAEKYCNKLDVTFREVLEVAFELFINPEYNTVVYHEGVATIMKAKYIGFFTPPRKHKGYSLV